jgi:hypothetical protein
VEIEASHEGNCAPSTFSKSRSLPHMDISRSGLVDSERAAMLKEVAAKMFQELESPARNEGSD